MFVSEYRLDQKLRELGLPFNWVFPRAGDPYGYDLEINGHRVEVKQAHLGKMVQVSKLKSGMKKYDYSVFRFNLHKHNKKEDRVDVYIFLVGDEFYVIPAFLVRKKTIAVRPENLQERLGTFKNNWGILRNPVSHAKIPVIPNSK